MSTLKQRFALLAKERPEITQADLARATGAAPPSVHAWIHGDTKAMKSNTALRAAQLYGCNVQWLADGTGPMWPAPATNIASEPEASYLTHDVVVIPQYESGGAMGNGGFSLESSPPGVIRSWSVDREWVRLNVRGYTSLANLCIITGFGPSMMPDFNPGDPLLLDRGVKTVESEGIYFFRLFDHGFIKQLQRIPTEDGIIIRAKSRNPDFEPFNITKKMDFEVLGVVLTIWKSTQWWR